MIRVREAIVVEGKYDAIRLASVVDALIVETNGFRIFKDKDTLALLRRLAEKRGLLILTDSDSAGFVIRDYLAGAIPPERIKHAYIPPVEGKERRKAAPSKEGLLGVEGLDGALIAEALRRAGASIDNENGSTEPAAPLTKMDLYDAGLTGGDNSAERRRQLLGLLGLPPSLSANRMLAVLNAVLTREQFAQTVRDLGWLDE